MAPGFKGVLIVEDPSFNVWLKLFNRLKFYLSHNDEYALSRIHFFCQMKKCEVFLIFLFTILARCNSCYELKIIPLVMEKFFSRVL